MSAEPGSRGMNRVFSKIEACVSAGNYYEAHQMYRTLYFRHTAQKNYDDCLELIYRGSLTLLNKDQFTSGADLTLLIIDTLDKKGDGINDNFELWVLRLGVLIRKIGPNTVERETVINRSIRWSATISKIQLGCPQLHKLIAETMLLEENTEGARRHYLLSRDGFGCGQYLVTLNESKGYVNEIDLFIAQVVLQQLCLKETKTALQTFEAYTKYHPKIAASEPPFRLPLLNFLFFLLKSIENGCLPAFKSLCEVYKASIIRDPAYERYLQKIGVMFFGAQPPTQPGLMGGMFGDLFNRLFQGFDEDDDETENQDQNSGNPQATNNRTTTTSVELD